MSSDLFIINDDVIDLQENKLSSLFFEANHRLTSIAFIERKNHTKFLQEYLGPNKLCANFAVIERNYVNKDYLTDYSLYYSYCFPKYEKTCVRIHFFSIEKEKKDFIAIFKKAITEGFQVNNKWIKNVYLGFVVIKPTPNYFIGYSVLKNHYLDKNYWATKNNEIHLFGNKISINSIAFQEQDRNVAACATIAIWIMLQRAAEDYYINLKSPIQITHQTGIIAHDGNRLIPNKGLTIQQMANAITKNNLLTEAIDFKTYNNNPSFNDYVKRYIYAYAPIRIPTILAIHFAPYNNSNDGHAVTVVGYNMQSTKTLIRKNRLYRKIIKKCGINKNIPNIEMIWNADRINKIYVHDDQWGPFIEMAFHRKGEIKTVLELSKEKPCRTQTILVSVFSKIRISYEIIEQKAIALNALLKKRFKGNLIWSVQLFYSEQFKKIIQNRTQSYYSVEEFNDIKFKFLTSALPKYIWVVSVFEEDEMRIFDFIYDATGLSSSNLILKIISYSPTISDMFINQYIKIDFNEFSELLDHDVEKYISAMIM